MKAIIIDAKQENPGERGTYNSVETIVYIPELKAVLFDGEILYEKANCVASCMSEAIKRLRSEGSVHSCGREYFNLREVELDDNLRERRDSSAALLSILSELDTTK